MPSGIDGGPVHLYDSWLWRVLGYGCQIDDPDRVQVHVLIHQPLGRTDVGWFANCGFQTGLLMDLPDHCSGWILSEVDPASGQSPEFLWGNTGRQSGQQDLAIADDHGIGRDSLVLQVGSHSHDSTQARRTGYSTAPISA